VASSAFDWLSLGIGKIMGRIHRRGVLALSGASALLALSGCQQGKGPAVEAGAGRIEITQDDIDWFHRSRAEWVPCESGAPAIVPGDMSLEAFGDMIEGGDPAAFARFVNVACAFFLNATFASGHYRFDPPLRQRTAFDVTDDHIKLLQQANWASFMIDCKRPYGDFTHFEIDMARMLGVPVTKDAQNRAQIGREAEARMDALHADMLYVLQAYVRFARLGPGRYVVPERRLSPSIARPLCRPVSAERVAKYQRALKAAGPNPETHRTVELDEAAAALFALS
jgi:hypothetical protein